MGRVGLLFWPSSSWNSSGIRNFRMGSGSRSLLISANELYAERHPIFVAPGVGFFPRPVICVNACVFFVSFIGTSCHYSCYRPFPSLPGSALPGPRVTLSSCPVLYFWPFLDVLALWLLRSTVLCPRDYSPHTDNKGLLKNKESISKSMEKILGTQGI